MAPLKARSWFSVRSGAICAGVGPGPNPVGVAPAGVGASSCASRLLIWVADTRAGSDSGCPGALVTPKPGRLITTV